MPLNHPPATFTHVIQESPCATLLMSFNEARRQQEEQIWGTRAPTASGLKDYQLGRLVNDGESDKGEGEKGGGGHRERERERKKRVRDRMGETRGRTDTLSPSCTHTPHKNV